MPVDLPATKCPALPGPDTAPDEPILVKFDQNICYLILGKVLKFQVSNANSSGVITEKNVGGQNLPPQRIELNSK